MSNDIIYGFADSSLRIFVIIAVFFFLIDVYTARAIICDNNPIIGEL
nr:MAG TPA: hypothetical protein [Bacteriophage sp.]